MSIRLRRRDFIAGLGGAAAWPLAVNAQQRALPVIALVPGTTADKFLAAFHKGMSETGYVEGQNVSIEYHWLAGQYERLPALMSDLVRRRVTLITTPGFVDGALAAKAATATIPIVFAVGQDPVKLGLVASLARPGGNATGINFLSQELSAKRLQLLHELVPRATRIAVVVNPANANAESILSDVQEAARVLGMQVVVLHAGTISEIDAAFAAFAREHADALFVAGDSFAICHSRGARPRACELWRARICRSWRAAAPPRSVMNSRRRIIRSPRRRWRAASVAPQYRGLSLFPN